jgi:hypothetical protein
MVDVYPIMVPLHSPETKHWIGSQSLLPLVQVVHEVSN